MRAVLLLLALRGVGCSGEPLDEVLWACASDHECGPAASCQKGLCVPDNVPEISGGLVCELPAGGMPAARFSIDVDDSGRVLVFAAGGASVRFALPAEVVALDEAPLADCCVNPCCSLAGDTPPE